MVLCFSWKYWKRKCRWIAGAAPQFFVSLGRWFRMFSEFKRWQHDKRSDQTALMSFYQFYRATWGSHHEIYRLITSCLWQALVMTFILSLCVCQHWGTITFLLRHFSCFWFFLTSNFIALRFPCFSLLCFPWGSTWTLALGGASSSRVFASAAVRQHSSTSPVPSHSQPSGMTMTQ